MLAFIPSSTAATLNHGYTIGRGLLDSFLFLENAFASAGDSSSLAGDLGWTAELAGLHNCNATVRFSSIALPIHSERYQY